MLIADTTRFAVPVLVTTIDFVLVVPTVALPKDNELGEIVAEIAGPDPGFVPDTPVLPHPVMIGSANKTTRAQALANFMVFGVGCFFTVPSRFQRSVRALT